MNVAKESEQIFPKYKKYKLQNNTKMSIGH